MFQNAEVNLESLGCDSVALETAIQTQVPQRKLPKTLYAHIPILVCTQVQTSKFVDFRKLLADPMMPFKASSFTLQKNAEGIPE